MPLPAPPCPCDPTRHYADCCGRWHAGPLPAPNAEALMRSRYSAFVLDLRDYLLASWHPATRPAALPAPEAGLRWLGLEIRRVQRVDDEQATVEFVARSKLAGRAQRHHETSRFVREAGRWFYVDGDVG